MLYLPPTWAGVRFSHPLPCILCVVACIHSDQVTCVSPKALCFVFVWCRQPQSGVRVDQPAAHQQLVPCGRQHQAHMCPVDVSGPHAVITGLRRTPTIFMFHGSSKACYQVEGIAFDTLPLVPLSPLPSPTWCDCVRVCFRWLVACDFQLFLATYVEESRSVAHPRPALTLHGALLPWLHVHTTHLLSGG